MRTRVFVRSQAALPLVVYRCIGQASAAGVSFMLVLKRKAAQRTRAGSVVEGQSSPPSTMPVPDVDVDVHSLFQSSGLTARQTLGHARRNVVSLLAAITALAL